VASNKVVNRSFFGVPSSGRPTPVDRAANAVFPLFLLRSFQRSPISGRPCPQFLRQLLPEPIALPPIPLLVKRTTKSGVSALDRWICAISAHFGIVRAPCSSSNDRSDAPSPDLKRSPPSKLPRAYTRVQKDLPVCKCTSRTPTRCHGVARSSTRRLHLPRTSTHPSTFWRVKFTLPRTLDLMVHEFHDSTCLLAHEMHMPHAAGKLLACAHTCQAFFQPHPLASA
jgi:hypothetical protein